MISMRNAFLMDVQEKKLKRAITAKVADFCFDRVCHGEQLDYIYIMARRKKKEKISRDDNFHMMWLSRYYVAAMSLRTKLLSLKT